MRERLIRSVMIVAFIAVVFLWTWVTDDETRSRRRAWIDRNVSVRVRGWIEDMEAIFLLSAIVGGVIELAYLWITWIIGR